MAALPVVLGPGPRPWLPTDLWEFPGLLPEFLISTARAPSLTTSLPCSIPKKVASPLVLSFLLLSALSLLQGLFHLLTSLLLPAQALETSPSSIPATSSTPETASHLCPIAACPLALCHSQTKSECQH